MIKGNYELLIRFDVESGRAQKELKMTKSFQDSTEFVKFLMEDLQSSGRMIDPYIPTGPEGEGQKDADIQV